MTCHSQLYTEIEMLQPVGNSLRTGEPLRWIRVHDLPDFVYFHHGVHVNNGVGCSTCHGRVDLMPQVWRAKPLTMQWAAWSGRPNHRRPRTIFGTARPWTVRLMTTRQRRAEHDRAERATVRTIRHPGPGAGRR